MNKFTLSVATVMAMSTFSIADGDIKPLALDGNLYGGIAYGMVNTEADALYYGDSLGLDIDHSMFMLQAGYQFHTNLAVEWRYWNAIGDADATVSYNNVSESADLDDDSSAWGIYLKPMYPVNETFTVYGLVGYGGFTFDTEAASEDGSNFQWGLGGAYDITDNVALFVDYVRIYDDDDAYSNINTGSLNFGATYKF